MNTARSVIEVLVWLSVSRIICTLDRTKVALHRGVPWNLQTPPSVASVVYGAYAAISFGATFISGAYKECLANSVSSEGKMQITENINVHGEQE